MGTSLSGLTPQTTFDGLLKVGDNDPLTADLKAISDGSGNDSAIQLSTGELKVMGQFNVDTDTAATEINLRGNSLTINQVYQANETTYNSIQMINSSGIRLKNGNITTLAAKGNKVGIGTADPTETLHIKGSGNDNTTNSLLVQNSAGSELLKVQDDGNIYSRYLRINGQTASPLISTEGNAGKAVRLGNEGYFSSFNYIDLKTWDGTSYSPAIRITGNTSQYVGIGETSPTAKLHIVSENSLNTDFAIKAYNTNGNELLSVRNDGTINLLSGKSIKFSGSEAFTGNINTGELRLAMHSTYGLTIVESPLKVIGSGNTNTTTALLVQNSDGTELLKVTDDGFIYGQRLVNKNSSNTFLNFGGGNTMNFFVDSSSAMYIKEDTKIGMNTTSPAAQLHVKGTGATSATTALLVQNSAGTGLLTLRDDGVFILGTAGNQKIFEGTVTNSKFRVIDNSSLHTIHADGSNNPRVFLRSGPNNSEPNSHYVANYINGTYIGKGVVTPTATLHVKGSSNGNTTTALLVENSDGTDLLNVTDDGSVAMQSFKQLSAGSTNYGIILEGTTSMQFKSWAKDYRFFTQNGVVAEIKNDGSTIIGGSTPDTSAKLQVDSTAQGFLPPRMTSEQKIAINQPAAGLMVYDTDQNQMNYWNGSAWIAF